MCVLCPSLRDDSSLSHRKAQREAAIVTSVPGTTRDILELSLDIGGFPVIVVDTAGLRHTDDLVESIGVDRAKKAFVSSASFLSTRLTLICFWMHRVQEADLSLCVLSLPEVIFDTLGGPQMRIPPSLGQFITSETFFLLNKSDLVAHSTVELSAALSSKSWTASLSTGEGTKEFLDNFSRALQER